MPSTVTSSDPLGPCADSTPAPSRSTAASVERVSAESRKDEICEVPSAIAAKRAARWEIDLSGGGVSEPSSGPEGAKRVGAHALDPAALAVWPSSRITSTARAASLSPATQSEIAPRAHVGGGLERHVLDVHALAAKRQRDLGDHAWLVLDGDSKLGEDAARRAAFEQAVARALRPRLPRLDGARVSGADQLGRLAKALDRPVDLGGERLRRSR